MDDPTNLMMITGVTFFGDRVERSALERVLEDRLLTVARFAERVVPSRQGSGHRWQAVDSVDLEWHLQEIDLPAPGDDEALQELVSHWMSTPLDPERPLWQVHLIQGYRGRSATLWRLHHCIGDGIALMLVLLSLTELGSPEETSATNPLRQLFASEAPDPEAARGHLEQVLPEAVKLLTLPGKAFRSLGRLKKGGASLPAFGKLALRPPDHKTAFRGRLGIPKRAAWTREMALADVDLVRQQLGGTINDVLTNAVAGGLRRYLERRGELKSRLSIRAIVPVSLRPLEEMHTLGNQFGLVFLSLPIGIGDTRARLAEVRRRMGRLKRSFEPVVAMRIMAALGASPQKIQDLIVKIFGAKGTAVLTNVPGPRERLYMAGKPMTGFMFWVPQSARLGLGISILSYCGQVRIGIATDAGLVSDPEAIVTGVHQELDAMLLLARESLRRAS